MTTSPETAVFDMHRHQLRQQEYPVPIKSSDPSSPLRSTTSISSDLPNKPFTLSLRVHLATHTLPVKSLSERVLPLLNQTPTYGPEEDWLRASLDMLIGEGILEPANHFDADLVLAFAGQAVKEYLSQIEQGRQSEYEVLDLDYAKHIREMESVRAMFSREPPATLHSETTPGAGSLRPQPAKTSSHHIFNLHHGSKPKTNGSDVYTKTHTFLGFRISPSPGAYSPRQRWASGGEKRTYFERQDDPYGGLM